MPGTIPAIPESAKLKRRFSNRGRDVAAADLSASGVGANASTALSCASTCAVAAASRRRRPARWMRAWKRCCRSPGTAQSCRKKFPTLESVLASRV